MNKAAQAIIAAILLSSAAPAAAQSGQDALRRDLEFARRKIYPALVNISVVSKDYSGGRTVRFPSAGSGTIVSPAGHVLTNFHVARDAERIVCTLPSGEQLAADVVGNDPPTDISVLKLRLGSRTSGTPIPFATLGDSDRLEVGDHVLAVGNPLSLSSSMSLGIVSNTKRVFTDFRGNEIVELEFDSGNRTGMFTRWIQHDALILPGNSGGPLVNLRGEIVGVNTRGGAGYGYASPSNLVSKVMAQILAHGEVRRGWLGASLLPVEKLGRDDGALVGSVAPQSPAEGIGLEPGDIVLSFDRTPLVCRFLEEVPLAYALIAETTPGREVGLRWLRDGKEHTARVKIAPMEKFVGEQAELRDVGLTVQDITRAMALARRYPSEDGVYVTGVRPGRPFEEAKPKIDRGDVIVAVGGEEVKDLEAFRKMIAAQQGRDEVSVTYRRDRESFVTVVKLKEEKPRRPGGELAKAWLGVKTQVLTPEIAKALGIEGRRGFRITEVYEWTKAAEAGLRAGDVIIELDDEALDAHRPQDARDLRNRIEEMSIGDEIPFKIIRGGDEVTLDVELEETPASALDAKKTKNEVLELAVRETTFMDRIRKKWPRDQKGVLVTEATSGGWADMGGLSSGDLIAAIQGRPVEDVKSFESVLKSVFEARPKVLTFFVRRGHRTTFVFVEPDWDQEKK